jgi:hypothetical protein
MKYILLIHRDEKDWSKLSESEQEEVLGAYAQFFQQIKSSGHYLASDRLHPTSSARSVRVRNGKRLVTDGPFVETREQLGGYILIDAKDFDEAIGIAARVPTAQWGTVEVRPVMANPGGSAT